MLDVDFVRENADKVRRAIENKGLALDLDEFLRLDQKRRDLIMQVDEFRREQNEFSHKIVAVDKDKREALLSDMKVLAGDLKLAQSELKQVENCWIGLYLQLPNIPSEDTPVGPDESANVEVEKWGEPREFDFKPRSHIELGEQLDLVDFESGVKTSGFRGYYLKNEAAVMHLAVLNYAIKKLREKGFDFMVTPTIIKDFALVGSGHFPFGKDDIYELANTGKQESGEQIGETLYLAGTSEPSLLAYYSDRVLDEKDLPIKVCGFSQCYRNEVGSYGKDAKGLYRIHEFMKVEQVIICRDDVAESDEFLEYLRGISQEILKDFMLPHRVLQICTGDMGAGKRKMYDIETWMPSRGGYGETHSDSNLTDWQTRRLNIKYKNKDGEKHFTYALNNTAIASPRILIAILENNQNKDGSVTIPEALVPLCGFGKIQVRQKNETTN